MAEQAKELEMNHDAYETLKGMFPIEDVIGDYLPIEPGWGDIEADLILNAECPFHDNGDRAKTVEIDRKAGEFRCTGCEAKGDAIDFLSQYERIDRHQAAIMLCRRIEDVHVRRSIIKALKSARSAMTDWQKVTEGEIPAIVCLCGSTRFKDDFEIANREETKQGRIVLSVGMFGHQEGLDPDSVLKGLLDELHKRKIDACDYVLVINPGGYIGKSTASEIDYAHGKGKPVKYMYSCGLDAVPVPVYTSIYVRS
jgi:hypothetical protein